ncbi:hypothetical protein BDV12DRAFT_70793 [Aspergillus spectabilis]
MVGSSKISTLTEILCRIRYLDLIPSGRKDIPRQPFTPTTERPSTCVNRIIEMEAPGHVTETEHGPIGQTEAGRGQITRYQDGRPTRFTFQHRFNRVPHVQITPDLGETPHSAFRQFWIYFLSNGGPVVDHEGFSLGVFTDTGHTVPFRWTAIEVIPRDQPR